DGVACLHGLGVSRFLELGPDGVLSGLAQQALPIVDGEAPAFAVVLRGDRDEADAVLTAVAQLWSVGVNVDWARVFVERGAKRVALPTYAFQRERFWPRPGVMVGNMAGVGMVGAGHPLLGA